MAWIFKENYWMVSPTDYINIISSTLKIGAEYTSIIRKIADHRKVSSRTNPWSNLIHKIQFLLIVDY